MHYDLLPIDICTSFVNVVNVMLAIEAYNIDVSEVYFLSIAEVLTTEGAKT